MNETTPKDHDADRLELLDRIEDRVPELDLDENAMSGPRSTTATRRCSSMAAGIDGGNGIFFANYGDDVHAVGTLAPLFEGYIGVIVIRPDGNRVLAPVVPDPMANSKPD